MCDLLLIGAGQLGSRYLQGLVAAKTRLKIMAVDPYLSSLETAKTRWTEAGGDNSHHQISWWSELPGHLDGIDLVLVVTSARERAPLVREIASKLEVRYWVLEKVLAQSVYEVEIIDQAVSLSEGAWVNTPRRMMAWHQSLRNAFKFKGPIEASYSGGLWGLACNSIHFIDLISWWMSEELKSVEVGGLKPDWFESKRAGYFEVTGNLVAHFSAGSSLTLGSYEQVGAQPLRIDLADGIQWDIDEWNGVAVSTNGDHISGCLELQSQLSGRLVDDILSCGRCELPTLQESAPMHEIFLEAMLKHWNLSEKWSAVRVPIT